MGLFCQHCHLLSSSLLGEAVCTLHLAPDISCMRTTSFHRVPSVHLSWPETCEHFVLGDAGDFRQMGSQCDLWVPPRAGGHSRRQLRLPYFGAVHRFAGLALRPGHCSLCHWGQLGFSLPKNLGLLLGPAWQRVWPSNALVPGTSHAPGNFLHMRQLPVSP